MRIAQMFFFSTVFASTRKSIFRVPPTDEYDDGAAPNGVVLEFATDELAARLGGFGIEEELFGSSSAADARKLAEEEKLILSWLRGLRYGERVRADRLFERLQNKEGSAMGFDSLTALRNYVTQIHNIRNVNLSKIPENPTRNALWATLFGERTVDMIKRVVRSRTRGTGTPRLSSAEFEMVIDMMIEAL
jgi:hypothetical protein